MNKQEMVDAMADAANISKVAAESALNAFIDSIMGTLKDDGKVSIAGFGSFEKGHRAARTGRNPQTGAEIQIPAMDTVKYKPSKKVKDEMNGRD